MALMSTFNSLTEKFWDSRTIADVVSRGHPILTELIKNAKPGGGRSIIFDIEYNYQQGGARALTGQMVASTPEIVTQGELPWRDYYIWCQLEKAYVYQNRHDPARVADYFNNRVSNAVESMKQRYLAPKCVTAQTGQHWDSLADACNDSTPYANIALADLASWRSIIAEAIYGSPATPISPSMNNFSKLNRIYRDYNTSLPDVWIVTGPVYDRLKEEVVATEWGGGRRATDNVFAGFTKMFIDGVPIITDSNWAGAAFDATKATRTLCAGHSAMALNFEFINLRYLPEWYMKWDEEGWRSPLDYTQFINQLHCASNIICRSRRHQMRIFGIDPTQDTASYTVIDEATQMNLSNFALPAEV